MTTPKKLSDITITIDPDVLAGLSAAFDKLVESMNQTSRDLSKIDFTLTFTPWPEGTTSPLDLNAALQSKLKGMSARQRDELFYGKFVPPEELDEADQPFRNTHPFGISIPDRTQRDKPIMPPSSSDRYITED